MIVTIPDDRLKGFALEERDALIDVAIGLYKRDLVSLGRAAEIAGVSAPVLLQELGRRRIPLNYDVADLKTDWHTLNEAGG
jgi:predicted HTH domain antitoxin